MPKASKNSKGADDVHGVSEKGRGKSRSRTARSRVSPPHKKEAAVAQATQEIIAEEDSASDMGDREDSESHFGADDDLECIQVSQQSLNSSRPFTEEQWCAVHVLHPQSLA